MPSYNFNERFYIVYNINLIMFYDLLIFIFMSYIKPQLSAEPSALLVVVYRTIPTSNHNLWLAIHFTLMLYIILFLHQTTTCRVCMVISELLYIILFLHQTTTRMAVEPFLPSCISYYSYIKPQPERERKDDCVVVYHTIPTSNHNFQLL